MNNKLIYYIAVFSMLLATSGGLVKKVSAKTSPYLKKIVIKNPELSLGRKGIEALVPESEKNGKKPPKKIFLPQTALQIQKGKVTIIDEEKGKRFHLENIHFDYNPPGSKNKGEMELGFDLFRGMNSEKKIDVSAKSEFTFSAEKQNLHFDVDPLVVAGIQMQAKGELKTGLSKQRANLQVKSNPFSLKNVIKTVSTVKEKKESDFPDKTSFEFDMNAASGEIKINNLVLRMDETVHRAHAAYTAQTPPALHFQIDADQVDTSLFASLFSESSRPGENQSGDKKNTTEENPLEFLKNTGITGKIDISRLKTGKVKAENIRIDIAGEEGKYTIEPIRADIFAGVLKSRILFNISGDSILADTRISMENQSFAEVAQQLFSTGAFQKGSFTASAAIRSRGATLADQLRSLEGSAELKMDNGVLKGFRIPDLIELTGYPIGKIFNKIGINLPKKNDMNIENSIARLGIENGIATVKKMDVQTRNGQIRGEGVINLYRRQLDGQLIFEIDKLFLMPVDVDGSFDDLRFRHSTAGIIVDSTGNLLTLPLKVGRDVLLNPVETGKNVLEKTLDFFGNDEKTGNGETILP
jgi:uncharacterized protein involved in outer membrane biogenesis